MHRRIYLFVPNDPRVWEPEIVWNFVWLKTDAHVSEHISRRCGARILPDQPELPSAQHIGLCIDHWTFAKLLDRDISSQLPFGGVLGEGTRLLPGIPQFVSGLFEQIREASDSESGGGEKRI